MPYTEQPPLIKRNALISSNLRDLTLKRDKIYTSSLFYENEIYFTSFVHFCGVFAQRNGCLGSNMWKGICKR